MLWELDTFRCGRLASLWPWLHHYFTQVRPDFTSNWPGVYIKKMFLNVWRHPLETVLSCTIFVWSQITNLCSCLPFMCLLLLNFTLISRASLLFKSLFPFWIRHYLLGKGILVLILIFWVETLKMESSDQPNDPLLIDHWSISSDLWDSCLL